MRLKGFDVSHRLLEDWRGVQVYLKETKLLRVCTKGTNPTELELELIQTQMAQKPMLRAEVGMRVRCANKASAE